MNDRKKLIKWLLVAAKLAVVVLLIWAVRAALLKAFDDLRQHSWHVDPPWLVLSGVFYLLGTLPSGLFWHRLLLAADEPLALGPALRAFYVSQVGKYVPGKAMVLILRAALIREARISMTVVTAGVFFETLMNMADGSLMALVILLFQPTWNTKLILAAAGMLLVTGLPTVPAIFKLAIRFSGVAKLNPTAFGKLYSIGPRVLLMGWIGMAAGWWLQGLSLWAVLRGMGTLDGSPLENLPIHTAVVALSVVAGFLALIPAGFGVRDLVSFTLLEPIYGDKDAAVCTLLLRLVSIVSDVGISSILYFIRLRHLPPASETETNPLPAASRD